MMVRRAFLLLNGRIATSGLHQAKKTFLTNAYRCSEAWNGRNASALLQKVNHEDFYNSIDQNYASKGVMSAIDVDIFANSLKDGSHLDELRDLLHKLRLTADTGNTLPSTHYAAIRGFVEQGRIQDILSILWDPLNYGIFLDEYTANILMDELLNQGNFEKAAMVASLVMLEEDFSNEITCALALYSSYKFLQNFKPEPVVEVETQEDDTKKGKKEKVEEIKIRVKYLRNPYFDDHFDLNDHVLRAGKTLAWIAETKSDLLHAQLQILGWLFYKKYDKLVNATEALAAMKSSKVYTEIIDLLQKQRAAAEETKSIDDCITLLANLPHIENSLENDFNILIENAINKTQQQDIQKQEQMFQMWEKMRLEKMAEQTKRLDEARRLKIVEEKQKLLKEQEQKLWFFENEEKIDLQIENKFVFEPKRWFGKKRKPRVVDENYIPPEILPKKRT